MSPASTWASSSSSAATAETSWSPADGVAVSSSARWDDEALYVREFVSRHSLPALARVAHGQYQGLTSSASLLLTSAGPRRQLAAQCVKFKEGRRAVPFGPRLAIPDSFEGLFEILSEDGKAARPLDSVAELVRRGATSCLVRDNVKALVVGEAEVTSTTTTTVCTTSRTVRCGEILILIGETKGPRGNRMLRCSDARGRTLLLPFDARGKFSALAAPDGVSGVHSARSLLSKRLPLMVRMVQGKPPANSSAQFAPEMRLLAAFDEEDSVMALPLPAAKGASVVPLPLAAALKLLAARNASSIVHTDTFRRLASRAQKLAEEAAHRIHVFEARPRSELRFDGRQWRPYAPPPFLVAPSPPVTPPSPPDGVTSSQSDEYDEIDQIYDYVRGVAPLPRHLRTSPPPPPPVETIPSRRLVMVLGGGARAEKRSRKGGGIGSVGGGQGHVQHHSSPVHVPVVAPVQIPVVGRVVQKGCLQHQNQQPQQPPTRLFLKSRGAQRARLFRGSNRVKEPLGEIQSSPGTPPTPPTPAASSRNNSNKDPSPSPLFRMRYKSLTSLVSLPRNMEVDTLDSSRSGGKGSGGSGGKLLPEKRSRRLTRPKSLTNLAWGMSGTSGTSGTSGGVGTGSGSGSRGHGGHYLQSQKRASTPPPLLAQQALPAPVPSPPPVVKKDAERRLRLDPRVFRAKPSSSGPTGKRLYL